MIESRNKSKDTAAHFLAKDQDSYDVIMPLIKRTDESVIVSDGTEINLFVYRAYAKYSTDSPCFVWAHGGGGITTEAKDYHLLCSKTCYNLDVVIISVDFRNAPENKAPIGQQDFVDSLLHILDNPGKFGIDPNRVGIGGRSGGGWIAAGAMNLMIKAGQANKVKALLICTGLLSNEVSKVAEDELLWHEQYACVPAAV